MSQLPQKDRGSNEGPLISADPRRLIDVIDLKVHFGSDAGVVKAVDDVSFHIDKGETLAIVGESGSGKSVTSLAIMGLLPNQSRHIAGGRILFEGRDITRYSTAEMRKIRGTEIGMIFQEPMTSLNPVLTVGEQIAERGRVHFGLGERAAMAQAIEMLALVKIPDPVSRAANYPHQMSGGMRQRVMIAMAMASKPKLLIADEPTTALDVTIQAQILELMRNLQQQLGMAILFITHDLGVVAEMADRVVVMYAGRAVEAAGVREIFARPRMPYTRALLRSIPRVDRARSHQDRLEAITGNVPNPLHLPQGCTFSPRCRFVAPICKEATPLLEDTGAGHMVRCARWQELLQEEEVR
jgi:oligopeptide/dipeptide ABC transporter ATP-binding protein